MDELGNTLFLDFMMQIQELCQEAKWALLKSCVVSPDRTVFRTIKSFVVHFVIGLEPFTEF